MKKSTIITAGVIVLSIGALAVLAQVNTKQGQENQRPERTQATPRTHKDNKKTQAKKEEPKTEIITTEDQTQEPGQQEEILNVANVAEPDTQVEPQEPVTTVQPVSVSNTHQAPTQAVYKPETKTLEQINPSLWVTLVNIGAQVGEQPNPAWTEQQGQANFERMANKLHKQVAEKEKAELGKDYVGLD